MKDSGISPAIQRVISGVESNANLAGEGLHVSAALDLGLEDAHDLAHVLHARSARVGDGGIDERGEFGLGKGFGQVGGDDLQLEPLFRGVRPRP